MRAVALALGLCGVAGPVHAQTDEVGLTPLARIEKIVVDEQDRTEATDVEVRVIRAHSGSMVVARRALALFENDQVITGANVILVILFQAEATEQEKKAQVGAATQIRIRSKASLFLILGRILSNIRGFFEVERPEGVLGARGTEFEVQGDSDGSTRLVVLEGAVEVGSKGGGGAPAAEPPDAEAAGIRVSVSGARPASSSLSLDIRNSCSTDHIYEIRAPESLAWVSLVGERVSVGPGEKRTVPLALRIDATRIGPGLHRGDIIVKCLDCDQEPGCEITSHPLPLEVTVRGEGAPAVAAGSTKTPFRGRVGPLQKVTMGRDSSAEPVRAATEDEVRGAVEWSSDILLAGRPAYTRPGFPLYFESVAERDRAFRAARFGAVWERSPEAFETLGNLYCDWGEGAKGLEAYQRAEKADAARQASPAFVAGIAEAYRLKGRLKEADEHVARALRLDPQQPLALVTLGNVRVDQSVVARDAGDQPRARQLLLGAAQAFDGAARADAGADKAAVARANHGQAILALGELAGDEGQAGEALQRFDEAEKAFQAARALHPAYPYSDTGVADAYRGRFSAALAAGDRNRAAVYARESEERYRRAVEQKRAPFAAWTGLGTLYRDLGHQDRAIEAYSRAVEARPDEPLAYWRLGTALARTDPARAAPYLQTYLDIEAPAFKQGQRARQAEAIVRQRDRPPVGQQAVPALQGMTVEQAEQRLRAAGFQRGAVETRGSRERPGTVLDQRPRPEERAAAGTQVTLVVAAALPPGVEVKVPKIEGNQERDAIEELRKSRLVARVLRQASCEKSGRVIRQQPQKDARVPEGTEVTITVASAGDQAARVPPLEKLPQPRAEALLRGAGLTVGRIRTSETSAVQPGTVLEQDPKAGEALAPGCAVSLTVAEPERLVEVPDFRGLSEKDASGRLGFLGSLVTHLARGTIHGAGRGGNVVDQNPKPGQRVRRGTPIDLWIGEGRGDSRPDSPRDLVPVPIVVGQNLRHAIAVLGHAGLRGQIEGQGPCVARQRPGPRSSLPRGSAVVLFAGKCPADDVIR
jgi:beta-lactam-binding protein with PASTA domain/tetratricopeptide (TPR) repeat protein